jgi:anti-sigma factor ChrR (cupin superfamily)
MEAVNRVIRWDVGAGREGLEWASWREGVDLWRLYGSGESGASAALLRYVPGAAVPLHEHVGSEVVVVLSGAQEDELGTYPAGAVVVNGPGSRHRVRSPHGCVVLVVWESPVMLVDDEG